MSSFLFPKFYVLKQKIPGKREIAGVGKFLRKLLMLLNRITMIMKVMEFMKVMTLMRMTAMITLMTVMTMMTKSRGEYDQFSPWGDLDGPQAQECQAESTPGRDQNYLDEGHYEDEDDDDNDQFVHLGLEIFSTAENLPDKDELPRYSPSNQLAHNLGKSS